MSRPVPTPNARSASAKPRAFLVRLIAGVAAAAVSLGFAATAVALAPAAQARSGDVSRIQVSKVYPTSGTTYSNWDMANPSSGPHYNLWTDARQSTVAMTATFVGIASFTVDGVNTTYITSGVPTTVPIHTGITSIVITQNDGETETPYYIDINRGWLITGFEIYNADDDSVVYSRRMADNNFDPLSTQTYNVNLPYSVSRIKWAIFYDPITEPSATTSISD